jgi:class 3 adenylate cyclase
MVRAPTEDPQDNDRPAKRHVTLLFTDIEGSTRLIDELGENGYLRALAEHRRLLRGAFSANGGVEVDTQGDAFLYAFDGPVEALAAAAQGQKALASGEVKVRMGLHTGELQLTGEGYAESSRGSSPPAIDTSSPSGLPSAREAGNHAGGVPRRVRRFGLRRFWKSRLEQRE